MNIDIATPQDRAKWVLDKTDELGMDCPTEEMIADAIADAEFDTINFPEQIAERHGTKLIIPELDAAKDQIEVLKDKVKRLVKSLRKAQDKISSKNRKINRMIDDNFETVQLD